MTRWTQLRCSLVLVAGLIAVPCHAARPVVLATTTDLASIVQAVAGDLTEFRVIMPAGADPHAFSISADQIQGFHDASLIVYAHSRYHEFEAALKAALPRLPALDWPDYAAQGASLRDDPGYPQNPHGPWLNMDNARAIARATAARLAAMGLPEAALRARLGLFEQELAAQQQLARLLAQERGLAGRPMLAVIPGVCDIIANYGVPVGEVLMAEGSGTVAGKRLEDAVAGLRSGRYSAIVCPQSMRQAKQGEAARQIARDSRAPLVYVHFLDTRAGETYVSQRAADTAAFAAAAPAVAPQAAKSSALLATLALVLGLITGLLIGRTLRRSHGQTSGAGIFES
jgi:ABC-type Zn uptake system ZnuABC Zn-binding protein ZnuA